MAAVAVAADNIENGIRATSTQRFTEQSDVIHVCYRWTIDNFEDRARSYLTIDSSHFSIAGTDGSTQTAWHLSMRHHSDNYMSYSPTFDYDTYGIYLVLDRCNYTNEPVRAAHQCYLVSSDGFQHKKTKSSQQADRFEIGWGYGVENFITLKYVQRHKSEVLHDGKLTVECDIQLYRMRDPEVKVQPPSTYLTNFETLLCDKQFADVVLKTDDGREISAHKAILSARSEVFRAMFCGHFREKSDNVVPLSDMKHDILNEIITFIYTDDAPNISSMAYELLQAADMYNLERLAKMCERELIRTLSSSNVCERLMLADQYSRKYLNLRDAAKRNLISKTAEVMKTDGWKVMYHSQPKLVEELILLISRKQSNDGLFRGAQIAIEEPKHSRIEA